MPLDLEEQEQVANLKAWWDSMGRWLALGLVIVLVGYGAYRIYGNYQDNKSAQAEEVYETLMAATLNKDLPKAQKIAEDLEARFPSTSYASMAGLVAANLAYLVNDNASAMKQLRWVEDNSKNAGLKNIARDRLIAMLLDVGDAPSLADADNLLKKSVAPGFEALFLERRGDWYLVQNKKSEALTAYKEAWAASSKAKAELSGQKELDPAMRDFERRNPDEAQKLLKLKIDSLGGF